MDSKKNETTVARVPPLCTLSDRHLLAQGGRVLPFPLPTVLWYCLKMIEETIVPRKLFSQAKCQMRTGKSRAKLKVMEGHLSQDRSAEGSGRVEEVPLGWKGGLP